MIRASLTIEFYIYIYIVIVSHVYFVHLFIRIYNRKWKQRKYKIYNFVIRKKSQATNQFCKSWFCIYLRVHVSGLTFPFALSEDEKRRPFFTRDQLIYRWRWAMRNGTELSIHAKSRRVSVIPHACVSQRTHKMRNGTIRAGTLGYDPITCHVKITRIIRKIYEVWVENTCYRGTRGRQSNIKRDKDRICLPFCSISWNCYCVG